MKHLSSGDYSMRPLRTVSLLCLLTLVLTSAALAQNAGVVEQEFKYDLKLCRALVTCRVKMYDYALAHIAAMRVKYPDKKDAILIEQARFYYLLNKQKDADNAINSIPATSNYYAEAQLFMAGVAKQTNKAQKAEEAFLRYLEKTPKPVSDDPDDISDWRQAVQDLSNVQIALGKAKEANETLKRLLVLKGIVGGGDVPDERELKLREALVILAAAQIAADQGKPVDAAQIQVALKRLVDVGWVRDGLMAISLIETAHANILLGKYKEAIGALKMGAPVFADVEKALAGENRFDESPLAGAFYYYAVADIGLAEKAIREKKGVDEAQDMLKDAVKRLVHLRETYRKSDYVKQATVQLSRIKEIMLKEFQEEINVGDTGEGDLKMILDEARPLIGAKKYNDAIPRLVEGLRKARRSAGVAEVGKLLVYCYASTDKLLEAAAVAAYLRDAFPKNQDAQDACYNLGAVIYAKADAVKDPKEKATRERLMAQAMDAWAPFISLATTHPKAPEIAFLIAENSYRLAKETSDSTRGMPDGPDKEVITKKAKDLYLLAVPKYEKVVEVFPSHEKGIRSWYKLGWIHYNTGEDKKAAEAFLKYAESETLPDRLPDILEAKFRAAERLMFSGEPDDAIAQFNDLLAWVQPGNSKSVDAASPLAKRLQEESTGYLAWAYDLAGESNRPQVKEIDEKIKAANADVEAARKAQKQAEDAVAGAQAEAGKEKAAFAELEKLLTAAAADPRQQAQVQFDSLNKAAEAERAQGKIVDIPTVAQLETQLIKEAADREVKRIVGDKLVLEEQLNITKELRARVNGKRESFRKLVAAAEAALAPLKGNRDLLAKEAEALQKQLDDARAEQKAAENDFQKWKKALDDAKAEQESKDASVREAAGKARMVAAENLDKAEKRMRAVLPRLEAELDAKKEQKRQDVSKKLLEAQRIAADAEREQWLLKRDYAYANKEAEIAEARLIAVAKSQERLTLTARVLEKPVAEQASLAAERAKAVEAELAAHKAALAKRDEYVALVQEFGKQEVANAVQNVAAAEGRIKELAKEREPFQAAVDEKKRQAQAQFMKFIKDFPQSKQIPDNMSRLGSIYLDFKDYASAATVLNDLATKHKEHKAVKQALFNLGRAQFESGNREEAVKVFGKIVELAKEQPTGNLSYIADRMLEMDSDAACKLALNATRELLARSESTTHPDREVLKRMREAFLFNGGTAARKLKEAAAAKSYFKELLDKYPRTGFYFDARFQLCKACRTLNDLDGAVEQIRDVMDYASDKPVLQFQAMLEYADIMIAKGGNSDLRSGVSRLEVLLLYEPGSNADLKGYYEQTLYKCAELYSRMGDTAKRDEMVQRYKDKFPLGKFIQNLNQLPGPGAAAPSAPAAPAAVPAAPAAAPAAPAPAAPAAGGGA